MKNTLNLTEELLQEVEENQKNNNYLKWLETLSPDLRKIVAQKGWQSPGEVVRSYQHLEKLLGAEKNKQLLALPNDPDDQAGFEIIFKALGWPEKPEDYKLDELFDEKDFETDFLKAMTEAMHKAGLNAKQASQLALAYKKEIDQRKEELHQRNISEYEELKRQWGRDYQRKLNLAKQAATRFGFSPEEIDAISLAFGPQTLLKKLIIIGEALSEDQPVNPDGQKTFFRLSPLEARSKIEELLNDSNFQKRYLKGEQEAIKKISILSQKACLD